MNLGKYKRRIMITGGAGFIGSHLVKYMANMYPEYLIVIFDYLTYAGNLHNFDDWNIPDNVHLHIGDIAFDPDVEKCMDQYWITDIINCAAYSHVDTSIKDPSSTITTNIMGTATLLEVARKRWTKEGTLDSSRFHQVSTDEVFGSLPMPKDSEGAFGDRKRIRHYSKELFHEGCRYNPHSPYSAAKASADHLVNAYHDTYGMNTSISYCSNNYGPNQFPEKLIPLTLNRIIHNEPIPIYGTGANVRDWIYVMDHVSAIARIFFAGGSGHSYCVGADNEWRNIDLVHRIIKIADDILEKPESSEKLITFVEDRLGHDARYGIDSHKIKNMLGWSPKYSFSEGLRDTIKWYIYNYNWIHDINSGEYKKKRSL